MTVQLAMQGEGGLIGGNGHLLLCHYGTGIGAASHLVQGDAGFLLALDQHPVGWGAAAIAWQQRAMQVIGAQDRDIQQLLAEHVPVVEGEEEIGLQGTNTFYPEGMVDLFRGKDRQILLGTPLGDRTEEALLTRIILMGEDGGDIKTGGLQGAQTGTANVVIGKDNHFHGVFLKGFSYSGLRLNCAALSGTTC